MGEGYDPRYQTNKNWDNMTMDEIFQSLFEPGQPFSYLNIKGGSFWNPDSMEPHEACCGLGMRREIKKKREKWEYL